MPDRPTYCWIITYDHLDKKRPRLADAVSGPRGTDMGDAYRAFQHGETFKMYDDDGELYYTGKIVSLREKVSYTGFEPLDDYGMPNAGCTTIKYKNANTEEWETL